MTIENKFSFKAVQEIPQDDHRQKLLKLFNGRSQYVRFIDTNQKGSLLKNESHVFNGAHHNENEEKLSEVRADILNSLGVPSDEQHVFIREHEKGETARTIRAFIVLVQKESGEAWYSDGRSNHAELLRDCVYLAEQLGIDTKFESSDFAPFENEFVTVKGFLSDNDFDNHSENFKAALGEHTSSFTEDGEEIDTPRSWFISGTSLPRKRIDD